MLDTVELYEQLTNRNMAPYHTADSLTALKETFIKWQNTVTKYCRETNKGKAVPDQRDANTILQRPKFHDLIHMIAMIPQRGTLMYHSCNK
jgi:hypothetical protein